MSGESGRAEVVVGRDGARLELLVGGIPYSTFHAERPWSGYVWDSLAAAGLLAGPAAPRVLLLGAGAGTVLVLLRRLLPEATLTAVELDTRVLELARSHFRLDDTGAEIVEADGLAYLSRTRRRFDLVIDDMYGHDGTGLRRPVDDEQAHLARIASRLAPGGIAATNSTTDEDPPGLLRALESAYRSVFRHRLALAPPRGYNLVLAGSSRPLRAATLAERAESLADEDRRSVLRVRARARR